MNGVIVGVFLSLLGPPLLPSGVAPTWDPWLHLSGVFDLAGPRADGSIVANGGGNLFLVTLGGMVTPFAQGAGGYSDRSGAESYLDVSPGLHDAAANCDFARDDVFVLHPAAPIGITRVDGAGHTSRFASLTGVDTLNGIVFDRVGGFDHRLLVTGPHHGKSVVLAIDCTGKSEAITTSAPTLEGGLAVAPGSFGSYGGDVIAPDELSGSVWAISPSGNVSLVLTSTIRHGQDTGVESEGFVPSGFLSGGAAYVADRFTPNNPHPGTDTVLRLLPNQLQSAGVREGDLLIAAEGGAVTIDIRCSATCVSTTIVSKETTAHGEGHLLLVATSPAPSATPTLTPRPAPSIPPAARDSVSIVWLPAAVAALLLAVGLAVSFSRFHRRLRRR